MAVVIVGGGIIGVSTAYFLAKRGIPATIIEAEGDIAEAASGKAGGFLARDWCSHYEMDILAREGFDLHMEFAKTLSTTCDYRRVDTFSASFSNRSRSGLTSKPKTVANLNWIVPDALSVSLIGDTASTAQVHPKKLTKELFRQAQLWTDHVTKLKIAHAEGLEFSGTDCLLDKPSITGVRISTPAGPQLLPADVVLLATGPWSGTSLNWLPPNILSSNGFGGHRAHSIVIKPDPNVEPGINASCLFTHFQGATYNCSPEVYPRPDGTVYICGLGDSKSVPNSAKDVEVEPWRVARLREVAGHISPALASADLLSEHACYLPVSPDGVPAVGAVPGVTGVHLATGHSCWGILTGPITGRFMAATIVDHMEVRGLPIGKPRDKEMADEEAVVAKRLLENQGFKIFDPARFVRRHDSDSQPRTTKRSN